MQTACTAWQLKGSHTLINLSVEAILIVCFANICNWEVLYQKFLTKIQLILTYEISLRSGWIRSGGVQGHTQMLFFPLISFSITMWEKMASERTTTSCKLMKPMTPADSGTKLAPSSERLITQPPIVKIVVFTLQL